MGAAVGRSSYDIMTEPPRTPCIICYQMYALVVLIGDEARTCGFRREGRHSLCAFQIVYIYYIYIYIYMMIDTMR